MVLFSTLVQLHDFVKIVELLCSPSNMACQKELLSKSAAVHKQSLSAFTTESGNSMNIEHKSDLHLAWVLPSQLRRISDINKHLALSHCREIKESVWGNWFDAISVFPLASWSTETKRIIYGAYFILYLKIRKVKDLSCNLIIMSSWGFVHCAQFVHCFLSVPHFVLSAICILEAWDLF